MMKKLLSALLLGLTLFLTACGGKPEAKPGESFVGTWKNPDASFQYEIKRNGDSEDAFVVKAQGSNSVRTLEGKLLDDTLIVNGIIQFTIDPTTGEMIYNNVGTRFKKVE